MSLSRGSRRTILRPVTIMISAGSTQLISLAGSGRSTPTSTHSSGGKLDLVEESIRQRQREADEHKKRVLAAYDQAARSGPAGSARFIDLDSVKPEDSEYGGCFVVVSVL